MKVLFVASGNKTRQPGIVVKNQAESLISAGVAVDYFLIIGKGIKGYLKNIYLLIKYLQDQKYDIIHSHYSLTAFATTIALWFSPHNVHVVSLMGSDIKMKGVFKLIVKLGCDFFWSKTIVKSFQMKKTSELYKAEIIPNGVDLDKIRKIEKVLFSNRIAKKETEEIIILFAANPSRKSKNFLLAKQSMVNISAKLKVVYDKSHEEIIEDLFNADVLLTTSLWEGSPNLVKEAMACNCPIVSTNVGDVEWLFGNEPGHYLTTFEINDVAAKIEQSIKFSRTYSRTEGRKRILELGLNSESIAKRLIDVYNDAIALEK